MDSFLRSHGLRKMPSFRGPFLLLGIAAVIIGLVFVSAWWDYYHRRQLVFVLPIPSQSGEVKSPPFRIRWAGSYTVELEVDRVLPDDRLNCLLGENAPNRDCGGVKPAIDVQWSLLRAGTVVASGTASGSQGTVDSDAATRGRILDWVKVKPGRDYTLEMHILSSMEELRAAHPRVVIEESPAAVEAGAVLATLITLVGLAVGLAGLVWLAFAGYWRLRSKRVLQAAPVAR